MGPIERALTPPLDPCLLDTTGPPTVDDLQAWRVREARRLLRDRRERAAWRAERDCSDTSVAPESEPDACDDTTAVAPMDGGWISDEEADMDTTGAGRAWGL